MYATMPNTLKFITWKNEENVNRLEQLCLCECNKGPSYKKRRNADAVFQLPLVKLAMCDASACVFFFLKEENLA